MMYYCGNGVPQDYTQAVKWFKLAAEQGKPYAQYQIGFFYQHGVGVKMNINEAIRWYSIAATNGSDEAEKALKELSL